MKIDLSDVVLGLEGKPVKNSEKDGDLLTFKKLFLLALSRGDPAKRHFTPEEVIGRTDLALKIYGTATDFEFSAEQIVLLKELLANLIHNVGLNPIVVGLVIKILDPGSVVSVSS